MRLQLVPPQDLHAAWDRIAPGLETCIKQDVLNPYIEDVYATIRAGAAHLYLFREGDAGTYLGFVVLQLNPNPWNGTKVLHIWYAHAQHRLDDAFKAVEQLALELGVPYITFNSQREAFASLMRPLGFEPRQVEYIKRVSADG